MSWKNEGIIGGILVRCKYDPKTFKSEAPDVQDVGFSRPDGGGVIRMDVQACYYNKQIDGGCDPQGVIVPLGSVDVLIDPKEAVDTITVEGDFGSGIKEIIKEISANPPDYAQSEKRKKKHVAPTGSPQSLLKWLSQTNRSDVGQSEVEALARAMAERGKPYNLALEEATKYFRARQMPINPKG